MTRLCRHFGTCGGCAHQDFADNAYCQLKRNIVIEALGRHGLSGLDVAEVVRVAPGTRRRASFKIAKSAASTLIGFHAAASHDIVDMRECRVLTPALVDLVTGLRDMMGALLEVDDKAEAFVTEAANGADVALRWSRPLRRAIISEIALRAKRLAIARFAVNGEILYIDEAPYVMLGPAHVVLPIEAFLQPTEEGQQVLQNFATEAARGAKSVADLFAGCGTFTFVLAKGARVHAVESDESALSALTLAARTTSGLKPVTAERRDLFRRPLATSELDRHDLVVLDPPRVGALAQVREIARSKLKRVVYVSCSADSFARDAKCLIEAGFRPGTLRPVDQFLWSSHIELVTIFTRT